MHLLRVNASGDGASAKMGFTARALALGRFLDGAV